MSGSTTITLHPTLQIQSVHSSPEKTVSTTDDRLDSYPYAVAPTSTTGTTTTGPRPTKIGIKREHHHDDDDDDDDDDAAAPELMRCKRRINFAQLGYNLPQAPPSSVSRRNERERNRVKLVNLGFATLREHVPNGAKNKKMSKVETLRSAVEYIRKLQELIDDNEGGSSNGGSSYGDSSAAGSPGRAENVAPTHGSHHHNHRASDNACYNAGRNGLTCPPSSVSPTCSVASSPTPSYTSEYSYEPLSPEEEDLLDFTSWFS